MARNNGRSTDAKSDTPKAAPPLTVAPKPADEEKEAAKPVAAVVKPSPEPEPAPVVAAAAAAADPAPAAAPTEAAAARDTMMSDYARRAVISAFGTLRAAQSTALTRYAAWILAVEAVTTRSLAAAESYLLGTFKLSPPG